MSEKDVLKTGTTTLALLGKDFVVLAADKRATAGHLIASKFVDKVLPVTNNMAITTAGSVSEIQLAVKLLKAEIKLKEVRNSRDVKVKEAVSMLGNMTYSSIRRSGGFGAMHFILGGVDNNGPQIYDIYPDGSVTSANEEGFVASGSGSTFSYGVLEDSYKRDLSEDDAVKLAVRAVNASLQRDSASGQGIDVLVVRKDQIKKLPTKLVSLKLE